MSENLMLPNFWGCSMFGTSWNPSCTSDNAACTLYDMLFESSTGPKPANQDLLPDYCRVYKDYHNKSMGIFKKSHKRNIARAHWLGACDGQPTVH